MEAIALCVKFRFIIFPPPTLLVFCQAILNAFALSRQRRLKWLLAASVAILDCSLKKSAFLVWFSLKDLGDRLNLYQ
ncbi:MAG: hypothetical protein ACR2LR_26855 [Hassallia sp.]